METAPEQRAALIAEACGTDAELRHQVETYLAADEEAQPFMHDSPAHLLATLPDENLRAAPVVGHRIGAYQVLKEIGRGGMGTVYLAERADSQYQQRVAIKVVRRGMDSEVILRRFLTERQILARLHHPNIARILDGGTTEDGLPYIVMEHIEGQPIDEYCDEHKLNTTRRIELFRAACTAVQFAHQNLIVHRDLKPSNILVAADGKPKLLDFGIAKLLNPENFPQALARTGTFVRLMTPFYASPEQVRGLPITTTSDIYALGVLLYELLTGHRPYRAKDYSLSEIERAICETEPEPPSVAINRIEETFTPDGNESISLTPELVSRIREGHPERLRRRLAGDLDNIVLMALRKEPTRRYSSVEEFSRDLKRHLLGLPVTARKDTFGYRSAKFIKRHKVGMTLAVFIVITIIAFSIQTLVQSARVARERDKAEKVSAFLADLFKVSDPSEARGNTVTAREILDRGAARLERELQDQPEVQATLMDNIGQVYESLGLYQNALALLEKSLRTRRGLFTNEHAQVAESLVHVASVQRALGQSEAAERSLREALNVRRNINGNEHQSVAETLTLLSLLMSERRDYAAAEPLAREALQLLRTAYGAEHAEVAKGLRNLAQIMYRKNDLPASQALFREALAMCRKTLGNEHAETAQTLNDFAISFEQVLWNDPDDKDLPEAEAMMREALNIRRKLYGENHPKVVESLHNLAVLMDSSNGGYSVSVPYLKDALNAKRRLYGDMHPDVSESMRLLGTILGAKGEYDESESLLRQAADIRRKLYGEGHASVGKTLNRLTRTLYDRDGPAAAESTLRQALSIQRQTLSGSDPELGITLVELGRVLVETRRAREAEPLLREGVQIFAASEQKDSWEHAEARNVLGGCLLELRRYDEAEPVLVESWEGIKTGGGVRRIIRIQAARARLVKLYQVLRQPHKIVQYRDYVSPSYSPQEYAIYLSRSSHRQIRK